MCRASLNSEFDADKVRLVFPLVHSPLNDIADIGALVALRDILNKRVECSCCLLISARIQRLYVR
jgi:hypothetical protein